MVGAPGGCGGHVCSAVPPLAHGGTSVHPRRCAGGAGGVTFQLAHAHGIPCTLVDPRPLKLAKWQHRQLQEAGRVASIHTTTVAQLQGEPQAVAGPPGQAVIAASAGGSGGAQQGPLALHQVQAMFGPELWRSTGWRQRFARGFSLVVACHPDQATDPALEYALEAGLPFAIVPCCVFARLFPHRRLPPPSSVGGGSSGGGSGGGGSGDGAVGSSSGNSDSEGVLVQTYTELVDWLAARGQAQRAVLGFEGANIVVWRRHPDARLAGL